ncbi:uncharacterized protein LOC126280509 [Schistocerca gregaria]|uniref:uncharacterized protein LOC126280509 n=1 Tax=Schistocerca gregaria TaxID=7010 RepID=UPI00211EFE73|nr:uncharacterized protein LOC126280509 [Schistocerca gregaria]
MTVTDELEQNQQGDKKSIESVQASASTEMAGIKSGGKVEELDMSAMLQLLSEMKETKASLEERTDEIEDRVDNVEDKLNEVELTIKREVEETAKYFESFSSERKIKDREMITRIDLHTKNVDDKLSLFENKENYHDII